MQEMATLVLSISGDIKLLGKNWVNTFIKRNPQVASLIGKPIESVRIKGAQKAKIIEFYNQFNSIRERHNIQRDIWNMDKHGIALGVCANRIVLGGSNTKNVISVFNRLKIVNGYR
jgi:hypothetical protein